METQDFRDALRHGPYAWPGGYPLFFVCDDGGALCFECAHAERRQILESIAYALRDGWRVSAVMVNWEDETLCCDHCSQRIASAYGEDE